MRRRITRLLAAALFFCSLLVQAAALAQSAAPPPAVVRGERPVPLHPHSVSWIGAQAGQRIEDIEAADAAIPWQPRRAEQSDRIDGKALWIRFDVQVAEPDRWFVEVGVPGIDRVQLFYRDAAGRWVAQEAGDLRPTVSWPVPGRYATFALAPGQQVTRYWMRVENSRVPFAAPLVLYRERTLLAQRNRDQFWLGAYFGIAGLLALASLASGLAWRDRPFLAFALYIAVVMGAQLARAGAGAEHVWPDWPYWSEVAVFSWPGLPVAAALWFVRLLTEPARLSRTLDAVVSGLVAAVLLAVTADAILRSRSSLLAVLALSGLSLAAIVAMLVWGWRDGRDPDLKLVAVAFLPVALLAVFPLARAGGLIQASAFTRNALFYGSLLQLPILYYALQVRSLRRRESEVRAAALSHADPLTGLEHRHGLLERLQATLARARGHRPTGSALLGVRVANLPEIGAEFGRETADKALVVAAAHLKRVAADVDLAARVGEDAFALLLEGPVDGPAATSRAQQIVASGLRQSTALPPAVVLKFQVAVALLPERELDASGSLKWLMDGLEQMERDARKSIRALNF